MSTFDGQVLVQLTFFVINVKTGQSENLNLPFCPSGPDSPWSLSCPASSIWSWRPPRTPVPDRFRICLGWGLKWRRTFDPGPLPAIRQGCLGSLFWPGTKRPPWNQHEAYKRVKAIRLNCFESCTHFCNLQPPGKMSFYLLRQSSYIISKSPTWNSFKL